MKQQIRIFALQLFPNYANVDRCTSKFSWEVRTPNKLGGQCQTYTVFINITFEFEDRGGFQTSSTFDNEHDRNESSELCKMFIMMLVVYLLFKKIRDILPIFVHIVVEFDGLSCVVSITVSVFVDILVGFDKSK